jgi:hypothetical protein
MSELPTYQVKGALKALLVRLLEIQGKDGRLGSAGIVDPVVERLQVTLFLIGKNQGCTVVGACRGNGSTDTLGSAGNQDDTVGEKI